MLVLPHTRMPGLRHVFRGLIRAPLFTFGVIATLGLSLGTMAGAWTIVDRVLVRPLPLREAEQVVTVLEQDPRANPRLASFPTFEDWRREANGFEGLAFTRGGGVTFGERGNRDRVVLANVSAGFMQALGVTPMLGRLFGADEERPEGAPVVLISESMWASRLGRDPRVIGRVITLDDKSVTIIGVVPESQRYPEWAEAWSSIEPLRATTPSLQNRLLHADSRVVGRLAPGVTIADAERELSTIQGRLAREYPDGGGTFDRVQLTPIRETVIGQVGNAIVALAAGMGLVFLLVSANVSGLAVLRALRRRRELAVRAALGASPNQLVAHGLVEWLLLSVGVAAVAVVSGALLVGVVRRTPALGVPRGAELHMDGRVALGTALVAVVMGIAIALVAGRGARRIELTNLRSGRGGAYGDRATARIRRVVTALQMALAVTLLSGTTLLVRSFVKVQQVPLGYEPAGVFAIDINLPASYAAEDAARTLYRRVVDAAGAIPGVEQAAFINHIPLGGWIPTRVLVPGVAPDAGGADQALYKTASESYAGVMGLRLVRGRWFTRAEVDAQGTGVVISRAVAARYWPGQNPIGRALTIFRSSQARPGFGNPQPSTVLGVVDDVRHFGPAAAGAPEIYVPFTREVWGWGTLVVRSALNPIDLQRAMERTIRDVEPDLPIAGRGGAGFRELTEALRRTLAPRRVSLALAGGVAILSVIVASLGLYAMSAFAVAQRTAEIGVRLALGATPRAIRRQVVGDGMRMVTAGVVVGALGAWGAGRLLRGQLVGTTATDPVALLATLGVLVAAQALALVIPARRAARLDPVDALRAD